MTLNELKKGAVARVAGFSENESGQSTVSKLREIGFAEGDEVELLYTGLFGGTPLSFRLNRTMIALRKGEASLIKIIPENKAAA
ncbi:FeoA family protein [Hirschia baltica]|uniref:FeoA family protein n=1 Tax=Hirschia baltica (strain ATCC 49814 / DSM 5838 / IFAM 1418) TaxID=582402 RepID=C6XLY8_HIRBI|nr:FeoA family protein [Hirschia baltica]ACT59820.1 FeoA family protein [Hirschia baltica ATCC 49814]